ncbi:MAG: cellulose synthase complex periplasmic endoglucanase BcsZ [Sutterellaceae bacterium]|nr:cellulose synthase complex periplasmic endoglucanase BcsZ [Sutterellaceae bacterium]
MKSNRLKNWMIASLMSAIATGAAAQSWPMWESFKSSNVDASFRVIDHSDNRSVTTSEGQSYAMFFALVADDRASFDRLLEWTEKNLSQGDITKHLPSWLWGKNGGNWTTIDTNNATDSDLWIAYNLLEAGRLWNEPRYTEKARAMMELLKRDVREVPNLGKVLLPGEKGFDHDGVVTLNPSYYPVFILRRLSAEDPYWKDVTEGTLRALVRSAPAGFSPDWVKFDAAGKMVSPQGEDYLLGSYNAIRVYMWTGMLSPKDPAYDILNERFAPMAKMTLAANLPPEKVNIVTGQGNRAGNAGFAACVLPMIQKSKTAAWIRTLIANEPIIGENYYRNVLMLYGAGFDQGLYRFDADGFLQVSRAAFQYAATPVKTAVKPEAEKTVAPVTPVVEQQKPSAPEQTQTEEAQAQPQPEPVASEPAPTESPASETAVDQGAQP